MVRPAEISNRVEDYLRVIYEVVKRKGYARTKDIATELGVKPPTVTEMLKKLDREGLISYERYGAVTLTKKGEEIARSVESRHETFVRLLKMLLVPEEVARRDAHVLEHGLSPKTIEQFTKFVEFISNSPSYPMFMKRWLELFRSYCESGKI
ncbi:MAG: metal-dependent transcriptional regulator [Thaumarchaeota archaeon]|nr:metal-dependent transcriptional regulator [Nitrososphaerota archaeon]